MAEEKADYTNRLINEKSPYLLQHAHNPVDWYPWSDEAFEKSRREDKPIFLSIGYSTCHWCHVMEEESFSNPEIAGLMNAHFVAVKVDREERPDLDNIYMQAVLSLSGSGGWPLNLFLTPELKPFYGGTYFPAQDKWGRPGLMSILGRIAAAWKNDKQKLLDSAREVEDSLKRFNQDKAPRAAELTEDIFKQAYIRFEAGFDSVNGGFGLSPKFPSGHTLSFLLRYHLKDNGSKALDMAQKTLKAMARGGIYDHIGGGFHRYSTDQKWFLPHFEKMLYDQAVISKAYLEAYQLTRDSAYAQTAGEILEYVIRDMMRPEGGFYCAFDADSLILDNTKEKKEGAFYAWSQKEIKDILGEESAEIFNYYFGLKPEGNVSLKQSREFGGKNILYAARTIDEAAEYFKRSPAEMEKTIKALKAKVFSARAKRPRPHLDDKILTDWNGLIISSLAFGSRVLNEPGYLEAAQKAADFILINLVDNDGRLLHRYRQGQSAIPAMLDDYAFLAYGLIDLYEASFNIEYLAKAKKLTDEMILLFWDGQNGGFFFSSSEAGNLLFRQKDIYDGAYPSGNSIAALNLLRLSRLTMDEEYEKKARTLFKAFSQDISAAPNGYTQALIALGFALGPSKEIVISQEENSPQTIQMINKIYQLFMPNKVVASRPIDESQAKGAALIIPYLENQLPLNGKTTVYVCENYSCKLPVNTMKGLEEILSRRKK